MEQYQIATLIVTQIWPVIMICLGVKFLKKPVQHNYTLLWYKITFLYKNPRASDYVFAYCGKRLFWIGAICMLLSVIASPLIFFVGAETALKATKAMLVIHFVLFIGTVVWSNATLKERFSKGGIVENSTSDFRC